MARAIAGKSYEIDWESLDENLDYMAGDYLSYTAWLESFCSGPMAYHVPYIVNRPSDFAPLTLDDAASAVKAIISFNLGLEVL